MSRRSLSIRVPGTPAILPDRPPISALFLIEFDVKAGYTIVWKQAVTGLDLEGAVEYKSLPSGLHMVPEDLIYFVHEDGYAGLSAFVNARTDEEETRHARMIAVGVLVPLTYGRLGRAWRHAEELTEMARRLAADRKQEQILEEYWAENAKTEDKDDAAEPLADSPLDSPAVSFQAADPGSDGKRVRKRSASDGAALMLPGHRLSPYHPARSLTALLDAFGPLVFPIHRAALLRKRILISTHAPVHEICNFVYAISILANIPLSVFDLLDSSAPVHRYRPLFNIGVHDIPFLIEDRKARRPSTEHEAIEEDGSGWIACTTDSILAMKDDLWDVLITMPPIFAASAKENVWPVVESPKGVPVKATQRDLRRFRSLRAGLARLVSGPAADEGSLHSEAAPTTPRGRPSTSSALGAFPEQDPTLIDASEKIVEPMTWSALAYSGFMWWASAGEQMRDECMEEAAEDASLLADLTPSTPSMPQQRESTSLPGDGIMVDSVVSLAARRSTVSVGESDEQARAELAIIAYFRRLTTQMVSVLADVVESGDDDDDDLASSPPDSVSPTETLVQSEGDDGAQGTVWVGSDALGRMGLDVWSQADASFVKDISLRYFARRAHVEGKSVEVCGWKVC